MHADAAGFKHTDIGNGERFADQHGARVRYVAVWGKWYVWDGKRWTEDRDGQVERLAVETVRRIYGEVGALDDSADRKALAKHARDSEAMSRVAAMLEMARSLLPLAVLPEVFDAPATSFLLNVENGTLDLRTGALRPHRPEDYITRIAPVVYDPAAVSPLWARFLEQQVPDPEVRAFVQRAVGYSLTGSTAEEVLLFVHGPTAAGKSTLTEAVKAMLGEGYAATTDFESFLRKRGDAGVRDDIARLVGRRMVLSLEVDEGRALAEGLLKNLTGGDTIAARHLYQSYFEFRPAFKLWLVANHRPQANAQDGALWRRVMMLPFEQTVPENERDPQVKAALTGDPEMRAAVLAWAVEGCLQWQRNGLRVPAAVRQATAAYRDACDQVGRFLAECFDPMPSEVQAGEMQSSYARWCEASRERPLSGSRLAEALRERGWVQGRRERGRYWLTPMTPMTPVPVTLSCARARVGELPKVASSPSAGVSHGEGVRAMDDLTPPFLNGLDDSAVRPSEVNGHEADDGEAPGDKRGAE